MVTGNKNNVTNTLKRNIFICSNISIISFSVSFFIHFHQQVFPSLCVLFLTIHSKHFFQLVPRLEQTSIGKDLQTRQRRSATPPNCFSAATSVIMFFTFQTSKTHPPIINIGFQFTSIHF